MAIKSSADRKKATRGRQFGSLEFGYSSVYGSKWKLEAKEEQITVSTNTTTTSTAGFVPAKSRLLNLSYYVDTVIPTSTSFDIQITGGTENGIATSIAVAAGTTGAATGSFESYSTYNSAAGTIEIVCNGTKPAAATGKVTVAALFLVAVPPTT